MARGTSWSACADQQVTGSGDSCWTVFIVSACGWRRRWHSCLVKAGANGLYCGLRSRPVLVSWNKRQTLQFGFQRRHLPKIQRRRTDMPCCGQRRQQIKAAVPVRRANNPPPGSNLSRPATQPRVTAFQYVGPTALTVVGPISGKHYRFSHRGVIVEVDPRDRASLATVPNLRQV